MIDSYDFGKIIIDGKEYTKDVIIVEGKVYPNWFRKQGHFLSKADLGPILEAKIHTLIIGIGYNGVMRVGGDVKEYCKMNEIKLIELWSREAVKKINELIRDIDRNGNEGIGKPEPLKHELEGFWSRRIDEVHRLVYSIEGNEIFIASCKNHYFKE